MIQVVGRRPAGWISAAARAVVILVSAGGVVTAGPGGLEPIVLILGIIVLIGA